MDIGLLEYCKIGFEYCWRGLFYFRIGLAYCRMGSEYSRIELEYCIIDYYRVQLEYCRIGLEYCSIEREKLEAHQSKVFILSHVTSLQEGTCGQNRTIELYFPRLAHTTSFCQKYLLFLWKFARRVPWLKDACWWKKRASWWKGIVPGIPDFQTGRCREGV